MKQAARVGERLDVAAPAQPESGPGGREYRHAAVDARKIGTGARAYWLFTPKQPVPASAPVVVFLHGWSAIHPDPYRAWIDHTVRRGHVVIYPVYQNLIFNLGISVANVAMRSTRAALDELERGPIRPELGHVAIVGHSMGGSIALNMAVEGAKFGLPMPRALMIMQPGSPPWFRRAAPEALSPDIRLIVLVGDADEIAGDKAAKEIFSHTPQIPAERKAYVVLQSDVHGTPPLIADHFSVCAPVLPPGANEMRWLRWTFRTDALDHYGYWRLFDALTACAFYGERCAECTSGMPEHQFMGRWSDGTPVRPIRNE